ncbi:MAG TPA: hypothetical protein VGR57_08105 [Ktedonobacterales bacterium]|nr:hypothetical protein [Ktedonobacterales bacterium]
MTRRSPPEDAGGIRAACQIRLAALEGAVDLAETPDVWALCAALAGQRGRPIHLEAHQLPHYLAGMWLATPRADYIFYAEDATPPYQDHIILHELAHMLCDHGGRLTDAEIAALRRDLLPDLSADAIRHTLLRARSRYADAHEREAELLASLIEQRWRSLRRRRHPHAEIGADGTPVEAIHWLYAQAEDGA